MKQVIELRDLKDELHIVNHVIKKMKEFGSKRMSFAERKKRGLFLSVAESRCVRHS